MLRIDGLERTIDDVAPLQQDPEALPVLCRGTRGGGTYACDRIEPELKRGDEGGHLPEKRLAGRVGDRGRRGEVSRQRAAVGQIEHEGIGSRRRSDRCRRRYENEPEPRQGSVGTSGPVPTKQSQHGSIQSGGAVRGRQEQGLPDGH